MATTGQLPWVDDSGSGPSSLAERNRPRRFSDLIGVQEAREYLSREVLARSGRSVLIQGPPGAGVTTLGDIYASSLLCPRGVGEPCLEEECEDCADCLSRSHFNWFNSTKGDVDNEAALVRAIRADVTSETRGGGWKVVTIEQPQLLSERSFDALHEIMDRPPSKTTFILCTNAASRIPARTRALFQPIRVPRATFWTRREVLERLCAAEGLTVDHHVLELMARLAGPSLKETLLEFERLTVTGALSEQRILEFYGQNGLQPGGRYVLSVLTGEPLSAQMELFETWDASPAEKVREVNQLLGQFFGTAILKQLDIKSFSRSKIEACSSIIVAANGLASKLRLDPIAFWRSVLGLWSPSSPETEASFLVRVSEFDELLNGPSGAHHAVQGKRVLTRRRQSASARLGEASIRKLRLPRQSCPTNSDYLTLAEVRSIINAASNMVQVYGVCFNVAITICWSALGVKDRKLVGPKVTRLLHEMRPIVKRASGTLQYPEPFHYSYVHESLADNGICTRVIASIPFPSGDLLTWLQHYLQRDLGTDFPLGAVRVEQGGAPTGQDIAYHTALVRRLCRGIDPGLRVSAAGRSGGRIRPWLADVLGIPAGERSAIGSWVNAYRCRSSRLISPRALSEAERDLSLLSVFDGGNEAAFGGDWELPEHTYRLNVVATRRKLEAFLDADWPNDDDPLRMARREAERARFEQDWLNARPIREGGRPGLRVAPGSD